MENSCDFMGKQKLTTDNKNSPFFFLFPSNGNINNKYNFTNTNLPLQPILGLNIGQIGQ